MRFAWIRWGGASFTTALTALAGAPLHAADEGTVHYVAEDLGNRTKAPEAEQSTSKGLSDSAVRVMSTFALSILPDQVPDPSGEMVKLDKSDPNKYLIPLDDARRVIRVATRSAYAEVCQLYDLEKAKALLDEMGLAPDANGVRARLRLLPLPYGETWARLAEYTRQQLAEIGIEATIEPADAGTWAERVAAWDYDMTFSYLYQYGDPAIGVARSYISSNIRNTLFTNTMGYKNERVDELFDLAASEVDPQKRQEYYSEVQKILTDELPVAWLIELGFPPCPVT